MKRKPVVPLLLLLGTVAIFGYSGCSAIGYVVGSGFDNSLPDQDTIQGWRAQTLSPGSTIHITQKNGDHVSGEYLGEVESPAQGSYSEFYNKARGEKPGGLNLPVLGDTITITDYPSTDIQWKAEFVGFDRDYILLRRWWRSGPTKLQFDRFSSIRDSHGNVIDRELLKKLIHDRSIPSMTASAIVIERDLDTIRVPSDSVRQMEKPVSKNGKWFGFAVGAAIDIAIIVGVSHALDEWGKAIARGVGEGLAQALPP